MSWDACHEMSWKKWIYGTWPALLTPRSPGESISIKWTNTGNNLEHIWALPFSTMKRERRLNHPRRPSIPTEGDSAVTRKHSYSGHIVFPCIAVGHPSIQWTTLDEYHKSSCHFRLLDQGQSPLPDENPLPSQRFIKVVRNGSENARETVFVLLYHIRIYIYI